MARDRPRCPAVPNLGIQRTALRAAADTGLFLRIAGAATAAAGLLCLPVGYGIDPKRDLSAFSNLADIGILSP